MCFRLLYLKGLRKGWRVRGTQNKYFVTVDVVPLHIPTSTHSLSLWSSAANSLYEKIVFILLKRVSFFVYNKASSNKYLQKLIKIKITQWLSNRQMKLLQRSFTRRLELLFYLFAKKIQETKFF